MLQVFVNILKVRTALLIEHIKDLFIGKQCMCLRFDERNDAYQDGQSVKIIDFVVKY